SGEVCCHRALVSSPCQNRAATRRQIATRHSAWAGPMGFCRLPRRATITSNEVVNSHLRCLQRRRRELSPEFRYSSHTPLRAHFWRSECPICLEQQICSIGGDRWHYEKKQSRRRRQGRTQPCGASCGAWCWA